MAAVKPDRGSIAGKRKGEAMSLCLRPTAWCIGEAVGGVGRRQASIRGMILRYKPTTFGVSIWAALAVAGNAYAAPAGPQGIPLGGFRLYPSARLSIAYDDNIRRLANAESDTLASIDPSLKLQSLWSLHELTLSASSDIRRYFKHSEENRETWQVDASGRADIGSSFTISPNVGYAHQAILRGTSEDDDQLRRPVYYYQLDAGIKASKRFNRVSVSGSYKEMRLDYGDVSQNGTVISRASSDRTTRTASVDLGYEVSEQTSLFVAVSGNRKKYRNQPPGTNRNSHGYSLLGGINVQPSAIISGQIGVGYISQNFKDPLVRGFHGFNYNANLLWLPTRLTSVSLTASRAIQNSALLGVPGVLQSAVGVNVDHELYRDLVVSLHGQLQHEEYRGIRRILDRYSAGISAKRTFNEYLVAALSYDYLRQNSQGIGGRDYRSNRIALSLVVSR